MQNGPCPIQPERAGSIGSPASVGSPDCTFQTGTCGWVVTNSQPGITSMWTRATGDLFAGRPNGHSQCVKLFLFFLGSVFTFTLLGRQNVLSSHSPSSNQYMLFDTWQNGHRAGSRGFLSAQLDATSNSRQRPHCLSFWAYMAGTSPIQPRMGGLEVYLFSYLLNRLVFRNSLLLLYRWFSSSPMSRQTMTLRTQAKESSRRSCGGWKTTRRRSGSTDRFTSTLERMQSYPFGLNHLVRSLLRCLLRRAAEVTFLLWASAQKESVASLPSMMSLSTVNLVPVCFAFSVRTSSRILNPSYLPATALPMEANVSPLDCSFDLTLCGWTVDSQTVADSPVDEGENMLTVSTTTTVLPADAGVVSSTTMSTQPVSAEEGNTVMTTTEAVVSRSNLPQSLTDDVLMSDQVSSTSNNLTDTMTDVLPPTTPTNTETPEATTSAMSVEESISTTSSSTTLESTTESMSSTMTSTSMVEEAASTTTTYIPTTTALPTTVIAGLRSFSITVAMPL